MAKLQKYTKGADAGDNEFTSFVNFAVKKKIEGSYKTKRFLMVLGYIAVVAVYLFVTLVLTKLATLVTFVPLVIWMMIYFTWLYVNIDLEYTIVGGVLKAMEVYGLRMYKEICSVRISDMKTIAPYRDSYAAEADSADIKNRYYCVSSMSSPDVYFGTYTDENGEKCVLFFEATEKTLKCIRYYNSDVVLTKTTY